MEEFVAIKPLQDYEDESLVRLLASVLEVKEFVPSSGIDNDESVDHLSDPTWLSLLKREALLFDKIYLFANKDHRDVSTELEWLIDKNIVAFVSRNDIDHNYVNSETERYLRSISGLDFPDDNLENRKLGLQLDNEVVELLREWDKTEYDPLELITKLANIFKKYDENIIHPEYPIIEFYTRLHALRLEYFEGIIATPLLSYKSYLKKPPKSNISNVAQVVIRDLPLPDTNTPWEKIIEYRENQDNQNNLLSLRRWIRNLSAENLSVAECKQELDWLKNEFQAHLKLHKIKANEETLEAVIKAPLEILENLVTLKFSKVPDPLFAIRKRQISLMEAELNAPGREIAYLIRSKQSFE